MSFPKFFVGNLKYQFLRRRKIMWKELLERELEYNYKVTEDLLDLVKDSELNWKPSSGLNWMTMGQLLHHLTNACGACFKGFVTGDWGMPEGMDVENLTPEQMLPPAEAMPSVKSVAEVKILLAEDRKTALQILSECNEEKLANETASAPWDPREMILGHRLLQMVNHLTQHKSQLFYYLKLQGKPVNTGNLWGM
jgi:uncharacterized damage-inducible protein DinB